MCPTRIRVVIKRIGLCALSSVIIFQVACQKNQALQHEHAAEIDAWRRQRVERLTDDQSWLTLAGLFWLHEGDNRLGGAENNDVQFPAEHSPAHIGVIALRGDRLRFTAAEGIEVISRGSPVSSLELASDASGDATPLELGTLRWIVIKRNDRYGVRLWDSASARRREFSGIEYFPIELSWRLQARFEPYVPPKTLAIASVVGTTSEEISPGALVFEKNRQEFRLDTVAEPDDEQLFVIFADRTSGEQSYGGGRFLLVDRPDSNGQTLIDFNKAYNPPCAFSPYATCPLPPPQNRLSIAVLAGEKYTAVNSANH